MKKNIFSLFFLAGILLFLSACDSMISDVDVPDSDPKLVVTGFLSPDDDSIYVSVRLSRPLYKPTQAWDNSFLPVNNAIVTISDGTGSVTLPYYGNTGTYRLPASAMPVIPGSTYSLSVSTPDGYSASSMCTIPDGTAPEVEITGIDTINEYGNISRKVSLRFRDLPGTGNFYRIAAGTFYGYDYEYNSYFTETGFERGEPYISDKNKEGEYFTFKTWEIYQTDSEDNILYISLLLTDENYFNYHRSVNSSSGGDNPFAEPTPVYSNINGGLGVFAGVNGKITAIDLENIR